MNGKCFAAVVIIGCWSGWIFASQLGQDLYQQALVHERAVGSLEKAIELFERAAREFGNDRELAAKALIAAARCYEKLGQAKAAPLYEQVVRTYSDQTAQAAIARDRLAASSTPVALNSPPEITATLNALNTKLIDLRQQEA